MCKWTINGFQIVQVNSFKYLEIHLNECISWKGHKLVITFAAFPLVQAVLNFSWGMEEN